MFCLNEPTFRDGSLNILDGISHMRIDLLRPSRTHLNNKVSTVEVFLERLADGGEEACKTPLAERYGLCRLLEGDASPLCPPQCVSPVCGCGLFASHLALLAYYFLLAGRRAAAEALAPAAVKRAAREAGRPCLSACLGEALSGREPAPCPPEEGGLYCLALAALIDPGRRGEALAAVEGAVEEALEPPPEEAAEGYGIVEGGHSSVELYFLYRMLKRHGHSPI